MDEIYKEYSKKIYRYLLSLTSNTSIAEELMQDTFYSAMKDIDKFNYDSSLETWLYKIAKNKFIDYCRAKKRLDVINIDEVELSSNEFEQNFLEKQTLFQICEKVHKLDATSREIFYLRVAMDFSFKDISKIVGISPSNARIKFHRIKTKLEEDFKDDKK